MNVLHVVQRYPPAVGGAEYWCRGLARWQAAHGDTVTVVTTDAVSDDQLWEPGPAPAACAVGPWDVDDGVTVVRGAVSAPAGPAGLRLLPRAGLSMLARAHSPGLYAEIDHRARETDVIHAHAVPGPHAFAAWLIARLRRRPFVLTPFLHAGDAEHGLPAVTRLLRGAATVVVVTRAEAEHVAARGVRRERIVLASVPQADGGTPPAPEAARAARRALGLGDGRPLLVFLGRKHPSKELDVLLSALDRLRHVPRPLLAAVGPSTGWFDRLVADRGEIVVNVPPVSEAVKTALLGAADLLVQPSRHESFGLVFLEAWAAGTAVVGADVASVAEVVGDAGWLCRPGDATDLAACLDRALADPAERAERAARGAARLAARFSWDVAGRAMAEAYHRLATAVAAPGQLARSLP